jgi:hypothetical protein
VTGDIGGRNLEDAEAFRFDWSIEADRTGYHPAL